MPGATARVAMVVVTLMYACTAFPALGQDALVEQTVEVGGVAVPYTLSGHGSPVILLHGGYGYAGDWMNRIPHLTDDFQVIVVGLDGEPASSQAWPFAHQVTTAGVIAVMDQLGLEKADVIGWGDGAFVSLELAVHYPARVGRIVLFGPIFGQFLCLGAMEEHRRVGAAFALQTTAKFRENSGAFETWDQGMAGRGASSRSAPSLTADQLAAIVSPILMLDGEPSGQAPTGSMKQVAQLISGPNLMIQPCRSHWAFQAEPEQLTSTVLEFLSS